jgi:glycosyltransferase involved in cell wall biosynthesis
MNVLVLAALTEATGNCTTARRIAAQLSSVHQVFLVDANETTGPALRELVREKKIEVAIGVHALLAGGHLRTIGIPYTLVFGGTDLYEEPHELLRRQMTQAVAAATRLVAFSFENRAQAERLWPFARGRIQVVPQAVDVSDVNEAFSLKRQLGLRSDDFVALLPAGVRRVKDPLHAVETISALHEVFPRIHLAVVGAPLEPGYGEDAIRLMEDRPGVHYLPALERPRLLAAMHEANAVLNTSLSEGMCGTLLEAMAIGVPVIARRNAGNESLVAHGTTGLLYDSPFDLVNGLAALLGSPDLRHRLVVAGRQKVQAGHTLAAERSAYLALVQRGVTGVSRCCSW